MRRDDSWRWRTPLAHRTMLQLFDVMVICEAIDVDELLISNFMN